MAGRGAVEGRRGGRGVFRAGRELGERERGEERRNREREGGKKW